MTQRTTEVAIFPFWGGVWNMTLLKITVFFVSTFFNALCQEGHIILAYFTQKDVTFPWHSFGQIIATSVVVNPQCSLVGESSQNSLNSGLRIILICPDKLKLKLVCLTWICFCPCTLIVYPGFSQIHGNPCKIPGLHGDSRRSFCLAILWGSGSSSYQRLSPNP